MSEVITHSAPVGSDYKMWVSCRLATTHFLFLLLSCVTEWFCIALFAAYHTKLFLVFRLTMSRAAVCVGSFRGGSLSAALANAKFHSCFCFVLFSMLRHQRLVFGVCHIFSTT